MSEITKGREITELSEKEFARMRYNVWLGSDMPKTIAAKDLIARTSLTVDPVGEVFFLITIRPVRYISREQRLSAVRKADYRPVNGIK